MIVSKDGKLELVVRDLDCEMIRSRIQALTHLVSVAKPSEIPDGSLSIIMAMIRDHLPDDRIVMSN